MSTRSPNQAQFWPCETCGTETEHKARLGTEEYGWNKRFPGYKFFYRSLYCVNCGPNSDGVTTTVILGQELVTLIEENTRLRQIESKYLALKSALSELLADED